MGFDDAINGGGNYRNNDDEALCSLIFSIRRKQGYLSEKGL